ncbi:glycosyltransferase family 2 protein [Dokdonia sp. Hel_I_53]|uniref:glycosyltransferase family 2 protein n=1 Tax=Dokdonia sp. Hel_I_53 TaxID=1566287 RepID=UPI0011998B4A|nr:glycosyltransferase family 2 protein [Dokdonia sp. Hel_I_53]TVZ53386.1 GT2 family glycosyltransferase [Dokdonia sp. Hel_I_53]
MNTYIIIVTYNAMQWIEKCLASIPVTYPIVIIDNNSSDSTLKFIETHHPRVKIFKQQKNLGFGAANNIGLTYALSKEAESVFLMNQDVYLRPNTISKIADISRENYEYGILSPIHLNGKGNRLDRNFSLYLNYDSNNDFYSDAIFNQLNGVYQVPFVNAAAWYIPKRILKSVGGFDPIFFHYGEDNNYCQRIHYHGFKVGVVADTFVMHDRQDREVNNIKIFTEEFLKKKERHFKNQIANPNNNDYQRHWLLIKRGDYKKMLISLLKGNYKNFLGYKRLLNFRILWFKQCEKSREEVISLKSHYL